MPCTRIAVVTTIAGLLFALAPGGTAVCAGREDSARYGRKMQVRVALDLEEKEPTAAFFSSGLDVVMIRPDGAADVITTPEEYRWLVSAGYDVSVTVPDLDRMLEERYGRSAGLGLLTAYHSYDETVLELQTIAADHPGIARLEVIGASVEGRDIFAMKISDNVDLDEPEPEVLFTGVHHAREPVSLEICLDLLNALTDNYGSDPQITALVDGRETWVVPIVNPDGYEYAQNVDAWWRKNRRNNGNGTFGVDINRNYGFRWGWDDTGSSPWTGDETYRGGDPFSEPETQAIRDLSEAHDFVLSVSHHTYGDLILYPWGFVYGETDDQQALEGIGNALSALHGYTDGRVPVVLYKVNGEFSDWEYGESGTKPSSLGFTVETGPEFYPPQSQVPQLVQEGRDHNLYFLSIADAAYRFAPPPPQRIDPMPVDADGAYVVSWSSPDQGHRDPAVRYEFQELTGRAVVTDDLEAGAGNWELDGFSWSSARSHSGSRSLYSGTGDLRGSSAVMVTDAKVRMRDALTFWTWYDIESGWDYAYVEASTDGGLTFQTLAGDITTNANPNGNNEGNGIDGSSGGWIHATFDLSSFIGEHVTVRFRYATDTAVLGSGFYVDDVALVTTYASAVTLSDTVTDTFYAVSGRPDGRYYYRVRGVDAGGQWSRWSPVEATWVSGSTLLTASLAPDGTQVVPGGTLGFTVDLGNVSAEPQTFEAWIDVDQPDGTPLAMNPVMGPIELTLPPGGSLSRAIGLPIPANAPTGGTWTLRLRAGDHPGGVAAEDGFAFDIVAPAGTKVGAHAE